MPERPEMVLVRGGTFPSIEHSVNPEHGGFAQVAARVLCLLDLESHLTTSNDHGAKHPEPHERIVDLGSPGHQDIRSEQVKPRPKRIKEMFFDLLERIAAAKSLRSNGVVNADHHRKAQENHPTPQRHQHQEAQKHANASNHLITFAHKTAQVARSIAHFCEFVNP